MSSNILQIHEFSRELIDITQKDGKWVSGGFGASEIANVTHPVPDKIKEAVIRGDLRINDNYPPKKQEFALLAKEIDEYAILAVATGESDDKNRPLIAYRYFWLEKPQQNNNNQDIDGIGTLILWWQESKQPKFNFQSNSNPNNLGYRVYARKKAEIYNVFCESFGAIFSEFLAEIKLSPYVVSNFNDNNSYFKLHYLALHIHIEFNKPLSWAWNVGILDNPKYFTLISAITKNTGDQIANEIKYQKSSEPKHTSQKDVDKPKDDKLNNQTQKVSPDLEESLKNLILNAIKTENRSHLLQVILFLEQHSIHDYDKDNIIDKTKYNLTNHSYTPVKEAVIYRAILALLGFEDLYEWAQWLHNICTLDYEKLSFAVQNLMIDLSLQNKIFGAYNQLKCLMFHNYSNLLLKVSNNSINSKEYKFVEWLLFKSKSIWNYYFKLYTQNLVKSLISKNSSLFYLDNKFYQQILIDLPNHETPRQQRFKNDFEKYQTLSILLKKIKNDSLSGLFYQLGEGAVPKEVYYRADVQIIPLTRKYTKHPARKLGTFIRENALFIIAFLCIFISLTGMSWIVATQYLPQSQPNSSKK